MKKTLLLALLGLAVPGVAEDPKPRYQKPHEVMRAPDLKQGEAIADIGSGSGYFTLRFSAHVGDKGRVYGVDIDPDTIRHLNRRIRDAGLSNVQKKERPVGPRLAVKNAREDLIRQLEANGFRLAQEHPFLPYQYFLVFEVK
jgi:predicted methyltransferase